MKRSQTKFKFIHCKILHCNFTWRVNNKTGLSLCFRPQVLPGQEDGGDWGEPRDQGVQGGHHAHGAGGGGRGGPQTRSFCVVCSDNISYFKLRVENPSSAASQVLTSSACGQSFVMSFADEAREARILPRVMGNHNGLLVLRKYQQMLNLHFTIICHTGN